MKSPAMSPPRKDPILNQDSDRIINEQYPSLPPLLEKYPTVPKPLFNDTHCPNKTEDVVNDYTDDSGTEVNDYLNKLNVKKDDDTDGEYRDDNSQALKTYESVINKTEEEEALTDLLMSMHFMIKFVKYLMDTISLCKQKIT